MAERIPTKLQVVFPTEFENVPKTWFMCMETFTEEVNF